MADLLDDKVNNTLDALLPPKINPNDSFVSLYLLKEITNHSDGQLNNDWSFLKGIFSDPDKAPSLKEKLAKAWNEKKYQSIRDIGRI